MAQLQSEKLKASHVSGRETGNEQTMYVPREARITAGCIPRVYYENQPIFNKIMLYQHIFITLGRFLTFVLPTTSITNHGALTKYKINLKFEMITILFVAKIIHF